MLKFQVSLGKHESMFGSAYIPITSQQLKKIGGHKTRLICKINQQAGFPCAVMPHGNGSNYIMLSKEKFKKFKLNYDDVYRIELLKDESEYGMPMPEELEEVLKQDPEGKARFNLLSPGKQRNIIYYTSKIKSQNLRVERAWLYINNLKKEVKGKERVPYILGLK
jgi:hypothetical protein